MAITFFFFKHKSQNIFYFISECLRTTKQVHTFSRLQWWVKNTKDLPFFGVHIISRNNWWKKNNTTLRSEYSYNTMCSELQVWSLTLLITINARVFADVSGKMWQSDYISLRESLCFNSTVHIYYVIFTSILAPTGGI